MFVLHIPKKNTKLFEFIEEEKETGKLSKNKKSNGSKT